MPPAKGFPPDRSPNIVLKKKTYVAKSTGALEGGEGPEKLFRVDISPETTLASHPAHRVT